MPDATPAKPAHIRELTLRSIVVGLLVAVIIGASYPYVVLKFGFGPNISVVSAFFGFLALGLLSKSYNRWENNIVQTAGTTAGQVAFLCWLLAAFDMLAAEPGSGFDVHPTRWQTFVWLSAAGLLGVFMAVPLRKHFIEHENLPFPDGMAAGETLIMLDSHGEQGRKSAVVMMGALAASGLTFLATQLRWLVEAIPLVVNAYSTRVGLGFGVSLLSIGSGIIIGLRVSASMLLGGLVAWVLAPPYLERLGLIAADARRVDILLTMMWPAVGMLVIGGMAALLLRWRMLVKTFKGLTVSSASLDLPLRWTGLGAVLSMALLVAAQRAFFGTPIWHSLVGISISLPLGLVALRVLGETNWGPISQMTNVSQAIFGLVAPGDLRASMIASGTTGAVAAESEGLMQDFRTGQMIGSTPRMLTYMQILAVPVGALALAVMYPLLRDTYGVIGDGAQLLSPTSQRWVGFAKLVTQEWSGPAAATPEVALRFWWIQTSVIVGSLLGIGLTLVEQKDAWRPYLPSVTGMGIGMVIPINAVTVIFIGAVADRLWASLAPESHERYSIPLASGLIAGEALVAIVIPLLVTVGAMRLP